MKEDKGIKQINFGSGPAALPPEVLLQASEAVIDYNQTGLSILEIPHRGNLFANILEESKALVKELCELNDEYDVLWLQGGGRLQFCMIPMNFLGAQKTAGYVDSGHWADEAKKYAEYYGNVRVLSSSKESNYSRLPDFPKNIAQDISYLHVTTNNTIYGTQWGSLPAITTPLIADMSSDIFSRKRGYSNCALFYAVAQKNIGAAGATLVVLRKEMTKNIASTIPPMLNYNEQLKKNSVLNTPPVFAIYTSLLMLRWTRQKSIATIEKESIEKCSLLYNEIERNTLFTPIVTVKEHRSRMNICFAANNYEIEKGFSDFCNQHYIAGIEGHRTVGGFRFSLYNAITVQQVERLVSVMQEYEAIQNSKLKTHNYTNG
ncbi:MAG TPA: 3-phosphoserine/phosphohydroxythreonine transaminase [Flavipsychrobacter sp.]|nr:3-phosphoserine/phosphohydroxythreonine transaminase [Flavipsychrobacter sp.]